MQRLLVQPSTLNGRLSLPPSKSQTIRAVLFASLAEGDSLIHNPLHSPDIEAMAFACRGLGATIRQDEEKIVVQGVGGHVSLQTREIDAGNSGLVYRFATAIAALDHHVVRITGDVSVRENRVIRPLLDALQQLGAEVWYDGKEGRAPFSLRGPIRAGKAVLSGEDSQPVSALLIACSFVEGTTEIHVRNPGEKPWVALTLHWLRKWGIRVENHNFTYYKVEGKAKIPPFAYHVPGDFSTAAFPVVAALLTESTITVAPLDWEEPQGDKLFFRALETMGAKFTYSHGSQEVHIRGKQVLQGRELPVNEMIDTVSILGVVGSHAQGKTEVRGAAIARRKECDRIRCLVQELRTMGAGIEEKEDGYIVQAHPLYGAVVDSHADHRLAMALVVAGLTARGTTIIEGAECIQKSFPNFVATMQALGARVSLL